MLARSERDFFHEIVATLPENATGKVGILKTFKIRGFFGKIDIFFRKNIEII